MTVLAFQNCGRASGGAASSSAANDSLASAPKFSLVGNALASISGQQIQFVAIDQTPLGTLSMADLPRDGGGAASDPDGASVSVKLYNARSGRSATLQINYDPQSYAFKGLSVQGGQPFMCHDNTAPPCKPGFVNIESGRPEANCASPIYYTGALRGSVQDITVGAWQYNDCH